MVSWQARSANSAFQVVASGGVPRDWTHRHVFFSSTSRDWADSTGIRNDPRYWLQQLPRLGSQNHGSTEALDAFQIADAQAAWQRQRQSDEPGRRFSGFQQQENSEFIGRRIHPERPLHRREPFERDWSQTFSNGSAYTLASPTYPA